jgi:hypothetical protein
MPFIGSAPNKTFQRTDGTRTGSEVWQEAAGAGVKIRSDHHDTHDEDLGDAVSSLWLRDGGNQPTADLPLNSFKFTGVGNATARTHFAAVGQVQDDDFAYAATVGGTADVITLTLAPAITAYAAGMRISFIAGGTNTTTVTVNVNSVGAKTVKKAVSVDLAAGDIVSGQFVNLQYDGTNFQLIEAVGSATARGFLELATDAEAQTGTDTARAITPANLQAVTATETRKGVIELATSAEAQTGTDAERAITPATLQAVTATDTRAGVQENATAAEMETGTATDKTVTPGLQHAHPAHPKAWAFVTVSGGTPTLQTSYNMTSITDLGVGSIRFTIATDFSSANWAALISTKTSSAEQVANTTQTHNASQVDGINQDGAAIDRDPEEWSFMGLGDQ